MDSQVIVFGDGTEKLINNTEVFSSRLMAQEIPESLRTFRYSAYLGENACDYMSSVQYGVYGLLNEYTAYYNGAKTLMDITDYLKKIDAPGTAWYFVCSSCANSREAYLEFKFYQLRYMMYAKEHYPDIYKGILANKDYCDAFITITNNYEKLLKKYDELITYLEKKGYCRSSYGSNEFLDGGGGASICIYKNEGYDVLSKELSKSSYGKMYETIELNTSSFSTKITSAKNTAEGVKLAFKKNSKASEYVIYRRKKGAGSFKKIGTSKNNTFTDAKAKSGVIYEYQVKAKIGGKYTKVSEIKTLLRVATPKLQSLKNTKKGIKITWTAVNKANQYEIFRKAANGSFKKLATVSAQNGTTYTDTSAKNGTTYVYKLRAKISKTTGEVSGTKKLTKKKVSS